MKVRYPSLPLRMACMVYETLLAAGVSMGILLLLSPILYVLRTQPQMAQTLTFFGLIFVWYIYFISAWSKKEQTLAMKTWHIYIKNYQMHKATIKQLTMRFIWACVFVVFIPMIDYIVLTKYQHIRPLHAFLLSLLWLALPWGFALFNKERQFLYDKLAGTVLIFTQETKNDKERANEKDVSSESKARPSKNKK